MDTFLRLSRLRLCTLALTAFLAFGFVAAACGGDDDDDGDTTPVATQAGTPQAGSTATAEPGGQDPTPQPGETPSAETPETDEAREERVTEGAVRALAAWMGPVADPAAITVESVEAVDWAGGCLEVDRTQQACTRDIVPGYRIMLGLGVETYEVRTNQNGSLNIWVPETMALVRYAEVSTNVMVFTTDDGGELVTRPLPGTSFRVDLSTLQAGDPVGIGIAPHPQTDDWLLVWVDPAE